MKPLVKRPREILRSLHALKEDFDLLGDLYNEVTSLITWFLSFEFIVLATFWFKTLQGIQLALDEEIRLLKSLLNDSQRIRESWSVLLEEASVVAANLGFEESFKQKWLRKTKIYFDEDKRNACEHTSEEQRFRVDVFYVALDKLIQEINTRFQKAEKINNMFSFIWNPSTSDAESSVAKTIELSEFYSGDLNTGDFAKETRHLTRVGMPLFGKVSSLEY